MEKLRQDIRANQFERVYLLYGEVDIWFRCIRIS